jgi:predicted lipoprotein with Yx(FWY)xxD motif
MAGALALATLTGCSGASSASHPQVITLGTHHAAPQAADRPLGPITLRLRSTHRLGRFLVVGGRTLYMYPPDRRRRVTCTARAGCETAWPPLFLETGSTVQAGAGVRGSLVGTVRGDGRRVVTYDGWPLYFYIGDRRPGQVSGQGQGHDWYVMAPDGVPNRKI